MSKQPAQGLRQPLEHLPYTIMDRFAIFCIKNTSNFFWEIADIWSYKNEKIAQYYNKTIGREYTKEYSECGITPDLKVLHIGCGAYPLTEIMLASSDVHVVVGIDKNLRTVQRAQEVIQRRHLQGTISIEYGDGLSYPVQDFDVIIISSCSLPKVQILQHLFTTAKQHCKIVVREVDIATGDIVESIETHQAVILEKSIRHNPFPFVAPVGWTTYCLRKT